jgi:hypothetical protein
MESVVPVVPVVVVDGSVPVVGGVVVSVVGAEVVPVVSVPIDPVESVVPAGGVVVLVVPDWSLPVVLPAEPVDWATAAVPSRSAAAKAMRFIIGSPFPGRPLGRGTESECSGNQSVAST